MKTNIFNQLTIDFLKEIADGKLFTGKELSEKGIIGSISQATKKGPAKMFMRVYPSNYNIYNYVITRASEEICESKKIDILTGQPFKYKKILYKVQVDLDYYQNDLEKCKQEYETLITPKGQFDFCMYSSLRNYTSGKNIDFTNSDKCENKNKFIEFLFKREKQEKYVAKPYRLIFKSNVQEIKNLYEQGELDLETARYIISHANKNNELDIVYSTYYKYNKILSYYQERLESSKSCLEYCIKRMNALAELGFSLA